MRFPLVCLLFLSCTRDGGTTLEDGGSTCIPRDCPPFTCGEQSDGCGGTRHCGDCCTPLTCAAAGAF